MTFGCGTDGAIYTATDYPNLSPLAKTHYYAFADVDKRTLYKIYSSETCEAAAAAGQDCFEATRQAFPLVDVPAATDSIVSYAPKLNVHYGDTLVADYILNEKVTIEDVYIQAENEAQVYSCKGAQKVSPWNNAATLVPSILGGVKSTFPLQASVQFVPPSGRSVKITDNIYTHTPSGNEWTEMGVMLKLEDRSADCRAVTISKTGTISQTVDANCTFE